MLAVYSLLLGTGLVVSSPWWLFRMLTTQRYREGLRQRLGAVPPALQHLVQGRQVIWVHAVSVGEVLAATRLVHELEAALAERSPGQWQIVVSSTTRTGRELARDRFGAERVFSFPLDFRFAVRRWLRVLQPRLLVLVESEIWPRLVAESTQRKIPVAVVNARISDRSFRRARGVQRLWSPVLRKITAFLTQGEESAERLRQLGVAETSVRVTGNLKYDTAPPETEMVRLLRPLLGRRALVVAGSLLAPEEDLLLNHWPAVCKAVPDCMLILAPRHPERFDEVARLATSAFPTVRAGELRQGGEQDRLERMLAAKVLLLDTVGDLAGLYALAEVAFVGGSLVRKGGHNPLEPARFGVPVVMGPSFENFREVVKEMQAADGIVIVPSAKELESVLSDLLLHPVKADELGQRGHSVFKRQSGASKRTVLMLLSLLQPRGLPAKTLEART